MWTAGDPDDPGDRRPSKKAKMFDSESSGKSSDYHILQRRITKLLSLMLQYREETGITITPPDHDSAEFHKFVTANGLENISPQELRTMILSLHRFFNRFNKDGKFSDVYLHQRLILVRRVWGPAQNNRDNTAFDRRIQSGPAILVPSQPNRRIFRSSTERGKFVDGIDDENQDDQTVKDIVILRLMKDLRYKYQVIPEADSPELYDILVGRCKMNIQKQELEDRIFILRANFNDMNNRTSKEVGVNSPIFPTLNHREIYELSKSIWGNRGRNEDQGTDGNISDDQEEEEEEEEDDDDAENLKDK